MCILDNFILRDNFRARMCTSLRSLCRRINLNSYLVPHRIFFLFLFSRQNHFANQNETSVHEVHTQIVQKVYLIVVLKRLVDNEKNTIDRCVHALYYYVFNH